MTAWLRIRAAVLWLALAHSCLAAEGCRGDQGAECLTDSDCHQGLLCVKRSVFLQGRYYEDRLGICLRDTDEDTFPDDYHHEADGRPRVCGVQARVEPASGLEVVEGLALEECNDNCPSVPNASVLRSFACFAADACCPAPEERKAAAGSDQVCDELTEELDTCSACLQAGQPGNCFFPAGPLGFNLDAQGCVECRPLQAPRPCTRAPLDSCPQDQAQGLLPRPACSGRWTCYVPASGNDGQCVFAPVLRETGPDGYPIFFQLDVDGDGVGDACDGCPELADPGQENRDGDAFGDACDLCPDAFSTPGDGIGNRDTDADGLGDRCDADDDDDGSCDPGESGTLCSGSDNCPWSANPDQQDLDADGKGDACDADRDGDEVNEDGDQSGVSGDRPCPDGVTQGCDDNCPEAWNQDQADTDGDGLGDACDPG